VSDEEIEKILRKHGVRISDEFIEIRNAIKEISKKSYLRGSNDCHKAMVSATSGNTALGVPGGLS